MTTQFEGEPITMKSLREKCKRQGVDTELVTRLMHLHNLTPCKSGIEYEEYDLRNFGRFPDHILLKQPNFGRKALKFLRENTSKALSEIDIMIEELMQIKRCANSMINRLKQWEY